MGRSTDQIRMMSGEEKRSRRSLDVEAGEWSFNAFLFA